MANKKGKKLDMVLPYDQQVRPPVEDLKDGLTIGMLKGMTPLNLRRNITPELVSLVNAAIDDSEERDTMRENFISWIGVLHEGRIQIKSYLNAVKYVSYKILGDTSLLAYTKTFPVRYESFLKRGKSAVQIAGHVSMYGRSLSVTQIIERTLVPVWILNSDILQEAINTQAELMRFARSETVRMKAAANLIEHLKQPESVKVDLNVGVSNETIEDLRNVTRQLAVEQKRIIESGGMNARQVAEMNVIKTQKAYPHEGDMEEAIEAEYQDIVDNEERVKREIKNIDQPFQNKEYKKAKDFFK